MPACVHDECVKVVWGGGGGWLTDILKSEIFMLSLCGFFF